MGLLWKAPPHGRSFTSVDLRKSKYEEITVTKPRKVRKNHIAAEAKSVADEIDAALTSAEWPSAPEIRRMNKAELMALAERVKLDVSSEMTNAAIRDQLAAYRVELGQ